MERIELNLLVFIQLGNLVWLSCLSYTNDVSDVYDFQTSVSFYFSEKIFLTYFDVLNNIYQRWYDNVAICWCKKVLKCWWVGNGLCSTSGCVIVMKNDCRDWVIWVRQNYVNSNIISTICICVPSSIWFNGEFWTFLYACIPVKISIRGAGCKETSNTMRKTCKADLAHLFGTGCIGKSNTSYIWYF
jgi:hypothetical protein